MQAVSPVQHHRSLSHNGVLELSASPGRGRGVEVLVSNRLARQFIVHRSPVWSDTICARSIICTFRVLNSYNKKSASISDSW